MNYPNKLILGPQVPSDHASSQSMPMPGPVSSHPPQHENQDFAPQLPPRNSVRKSAGFQNEARGGGERMQSSNIGSVLKSSDNADSMTQSRQGKEIEDAEKDRYVAQLK